MGDRGTARPTLALMQPAKPRPGPRVRTMLWRGLRRRCPRCGGKGAWFTGWFAKGDRCLTCGYRYGRQPGFELGAVTINTVVTFGLFAVVLLVSVILTYPELPLLPVMGAGLAVVIVVPIALYPVSYTLWGAVDLAMRPLEPAEEADAATGLAALERLGQARSVSGRPVPPTKSAEDA